jgi:hypothetical protein
VGEILWQAPAPLSTVAEWRHSSGSLVVSVYPDPAARNDAEWATNGSWVVAVDGAGSSASGFPRQVPPAGEWITAGPIVTPNLAGSQRVLVGTRSGQLIAIGESGDLPFGSTGSAILALASVEKAGVTYVAVADSMGGVAIQDLSGAETLSERTQVGAPGWRPRLAWVEMNVGSGGVTQDDAGAISSSLPQLVVLAAESGGGGIYEVSGGLLDRLSEIRGVGVPFADGLSAGDLDGDGFNEIVLSTIDGRVGFWNLSGGATPGWPRTLDPEPFVTHSSPLVADVDGQPGLEIIAITGSGRLYALDQNRKPLPGWPLGTGAGQVAHPALLDLEGNGTLELLVGDADSLLHAYTMANADTAASPWSVWGGDPGRSFALVGSPAGGGLPQGTLVIDGTLKCYPNPAQRMPMTVSFALREPAECRLTIFDPSGRQVADITQQGIRSDNSIIWDPSRNGPGLYVGRLEITGQAASESHLVHMAVLR